MPQLSPECFYDHCGECRDLGCGDHCHEDEAFDLVANEWVEIEGTS